MVKSGHCLLGTSRPSFCELVSLLSQHVSLLLFLHTAAHVLAAQQHMRRRSGVTLHCQ